MKKLITGFCFLCLIVLASTKFQLILPAEAASPAPPQAPASNPHPPQSKQDIARVKFAEESVKMLLMQTLDSKLQMSDFDKSPAFENKTLNCLKNIACYEKDKRFVNELLKLQAQDGLVIEIKHAHIIPWSMKRMNIRSSVPVQTPGKNEKTKAPFSGMEGPSLNPDEFMVHIYAKFDKNQRWYHLDVILTEDQKGNIFLRHFYAIPMPYIEEHLPPGAVC